MLTLCPECGKQISDQADACPHCGFPIAPKPKPKRKSSRRKRLPNGFGSIVELKNRNLREPFFCRICVGKDKDGKFILKALKPKAYFATYNEAYTALALYHQNPYKLEDSCTLQQLYDKWSVNYFADQKNQSSVRSIKSAWSYVDDAMKRTQVPDITIYSMKETIRLAHRIDEKGRYLEASANTRSRMKSNFNLLFDFAVEASIVPINLARQFSSKGIQEEIESNRKEKVPISREDEALLWEHPDIGCSKLTLINIYTGWRPDELVGIKLCDMDMERGFMRGGEKTEAGTNRMVPIHPKIYDLVKHYYDVAVENGSEYLFYDSKYYPMSVQPQTYDQYRHRFAEICKYHGWTQYSPSCPRHAFATRCEEDKLDDYAIKLMMGHKIKDVTLQHYTHLDLYKYLPEQLLKLT